LHDVGTARIGGVEETYLVMELVEGETLAARLHRGPLPLDQALSAAIDVAEALVAAHAAGLVHRDLKPANVMLTRSGAKLLDFGLARPRASAHGERGSAASGPPLKEDAIVGTLPYMAPEQLNGATPDARSDLFAFGAMLYEMIGGSRAFDAGSQAELVAAVLEHEPPPLSTRMPTVSPALDRLIATCLAKEPDDRWQTATDLLRELRWTRDDRVVSAPPAGIAPVAPRRSVALAAASAIAILALAAIGFRPQADRPVSRVSFSVHPPDGAQFPRGTAEMALSPDGSRLVFVALSADGTRQLWLRRFDSVDSRAIDGSDDAAHPFWSPDGRSIAFFAHGKLRRLAESGGLPQDLCDVRRGARGGTWNRDGTIVFGAFGQPLARVADTGGVPTAATTLDASLTHHTHAWPVFLPDGRRFLYLGQSQDPAQTAIHQGTLDSNESRRVLAGESRIGFAAGQLLSLSKGLLIARPYDAASAKVGEAAMTIAEHISYDTPLRSGGAFSVATGRAIAYRSASPDSRLVWFDRSGHEVGSVATDADYHHPWLSPDEKRVAVEKTDATTGRHTIWILDLSRGTTARLLLDPSGAHGPVWSPDGRRISFLSNRLGGVDLYEMPADGSTTDKLILSSQEGGIESTDWSLDGRFLLYQFHRRGQYDLLTLAMPPAGDPQPLVVSSAQELQGQFSPDTRWVAYTSDESGTPEVYVRKFPDAAGKWQVSTRGGTQPRWRRDGKELFYLALDGRLMAVTVATSNNAIETGAPRELFNTGITGSFLDRRNQYVVTRDGQRFLVNISAEDENSAPITVVLNWGSARLSERR
jgi:Tol biopolymer transport system component